MTLASQPTRRPAPGGVEIIADKWAVVVLYGLADEPQRHGELARLIGGISHKVLTHTLRRLESSGLVARHAYAEAPPRVPAAAKTIRGYLGTSARPGPPPRRTAVNAAVLSASASS